MRRVWNVAWLAAIGFGVWRLTARRAIGSPSPTARGRLAGKAIVILATDGFEESELVETRRLLCKAGARCVVAAPHAGAIEGVRHDRAGARVVVDRVLTEVVADDYDAVLLPGGVANADALRRDPTAVALVKRFAALGKPIAAICHAPWLLIEAKVLDDRLVTSWPSLQTDLINAGAKWIDQTVVTDGLLITSRKPQDIPAFASQLEETLTRGEESIDGQGPRSEGPTSKDSTVGEKEEPQPQAVRKTGERQGRARHA